MSRTPHRRGPARSIIASLAAAFAALLCVTGQAAAQWASDFAAPGPNERVRALAMYDDGTGPALYAGGQFDAIDGQPLSKIAKYRNGLWSDVGGGFSSVGSSQEVRALVVFDGELVAGGYFGHAGGRTVNFIARWNGNEWQPFGHGLPGAVDDVTIFDGQLVATGSFGDFGSNVALWDGTTWLPIGHLSVHFGRLAVYNGELIAAGYFWNSSGHIARWTGSAWEVFGHGTDQRVTALTVFDGELIAGGWFSTAGGVPSNGLARWDGRCWHALGDGLVRYASSFAIQNSSLIVHGLMQVAGRGSTNVLATWDGTTWSVFPDCVTTGLSSPVVHAILPVDDASGPAPIVGGWFTKAGSTCANNVARYARGQWSRLSECEQCLGLSGPVRGLAVHDDGSGEALYVAGACQCAGTTSIDGVGRWDGQTWSTVGSPFTTFAPNTGGANPYVLTLASFDDGSGHGARLYVGGYFSSAADHHAYSIAMWDGRDWSDVGGGIYHGTVYDLTVFDDGAGPALYAGDRFSNVGGTTISNVAKWDGRQWSEVGGGIPLTNSAYVIDMMAWNDGAGEGLLIGGRFSSVGSGPTALQTRGVALWRNGNWHAFGDWGFGAGNAYVRSLAAWPPNGSGFVAAGAFLAGNGGPVSGTMERWNGTAWQNITPPSIPGITIQNYTVFSMQSAACDQLFANGYYPFGRVLVWNGDLWRPMAGGVADPAGGPWGVQYNGTSVPYSNFATFQDRVYFAGDFTSAGGLPASNIAIWDPVVALTCAPDANGDGEIDVIDLLAVLTQWGSCLETCLADSAPCGGDGQISLDDLVAVIISWGPCPR